MKSQMKFNTITKSIASLIVLGGFIWLVAGSISGDFPEISNKLLSDGRYEETATFRTIDGLETSIVVSTGHKDEKGLWDGEVEIKEYDVEGAGPKITSAWSGPCVDGLKHGNWTITYPNGTEEYKKFDMGLEDGTWKSFALTPSMNSAFDIVQTKYSLFLGTLKLFDLTDDKMRIYTDSLDAILSRKDFDSLSFDEFYDAAHSELDNYPVFDSISNTISRVIYPDGMYRIKRDELRLAVLDRNRNGSGTTSSVVSSTYPGYRASMNANGATNEDFDAFCQDLDSIMDGYGPLNPADPFFIDSVDARMYRALGKMSSQSPTFGPLLTLQTRSGTGNLKISLEEAGKILQPLIGKSSSNDAVMGIFLKFILMEYGEADIIKKAVRETCFLKREWARFPVLTTVYSSRNSSASVDLRGNVLESGGADVTSRGIVWAETYNPIVDDHRVNSGNGTGIFHVTLDGLQSGKTYYARTFATNRAGTAYGNIIEFTTERVSSADLPASGIRDLSIYPNPATGPVTFTYFVESPGTISITLFDNNGRVIYALNTDQSQSGTFTVGADLSRIPPGIYFCRVTDGERVSGHKLMIVK